MPTKDDLDNHSDQLNSNNEKYYKARAHNQPPENQLVQKNQKNPTKGPDGSHERYQGSGDGAYNNANQTINRQKQ